MRQLLILPLLVALAGCRSAPHVDPVPPTAWQAAEGSSRTSQPTPVARRDPSRPQPSSQALTKEQVLALAADRDPQDAIAEIDRHPLAFPLTKNNIAWFEDRVAPPELVDYLGKRSAVDWDALAQAPPPPAAPEAEPYYGSAPAPAPPTTVYVERPGPTTIIYENDYPYGYYYGGGTVYVGGYYGGYWNNNYYYNRGYRNPVVISGQTSATIYRSNGGVVVSGAQPVAGLGVAPPAGIYRSTVVRGPAPQVVITRSSRHR